MGGGGRRDNPDPGRPLQCPLPLPSHPPPCPPTPAGREPGSAPEVEARGQAASAELSALVNGFILRRTNALLRQHLPPKASKGGGRWQ